MQHELSTIASIKKQFLQNIPVNQINWHESFDFSETLQSELLKSTIQSESILLYSVRVEYQKAFLKHFINGLIKQETVIADPCYEEYARLVATPSKAVNFKHYDIGSRTIILQENCSFISEGTTGLVTWQASFALSEWILQNPDHFHDKRILELGSGIGLTGLILSMIDTKSVILSDYHHSVLKTLLNNIKINHNCDLNLEESCSLESGVNLKVLNLDWEHFNAKNCEKLGLVDILVAADVVYDKSLFKYLIGVVKLSFEHCATREFILSCSERNSDTLEEFLDLARAQFYIRELQLPKKRLFYWTEEVPVRIFSVTAHQV